MIALVALDMAGTTIEEGGTVYDVLAATVAAHVGSPVPDDVVARWHGAEKREAIVGILGELGAPPTEELADELFAQFAADLDRAYLDRPPQPLPGVPEALARLRAVGIRVALTTGFSDRVAEGILAGIGWTVGATVDVLVTAHQVGAGRPSPRMIHEAMARTGVTDPAQVLVAGDTPRDLAAGSRAEAGAVVGVLTGASSRDELMAGHATHVLDGVADLPELIATLGGGPGGPP